MNLIASLYELFGWFDSDLGEHLQGWDGKDYSGLAQYLIFFVGCFILVVLVVLFFYKLFDNIRFNKRIHWLITLVITLSICFTWPFVKITNDLSTESVASDLSFNSSDALGFAVTNVILMMILFVFSSIVFSRLSINNRFTPLKQ